MALTVAACTSSRPSPAAEAHGSLARLDVRADAAALAKDAASPKRTEPASTERAVGEAPAEAGRDGARPAVLSVGRAAHESNVPRDYDSRDDALDYAFTPPPTDVYVVAGEYEPVQALILALADDALELLPRYVELIAAGQREARVVVLYNSDEAKDALLTALAADKIELLDVELERVPLDSAWIRDYGPVFALTTSGDFRIIDTRYYDARLQDDVVPTRVGEAWGFAVSRPPLVSEGGNLLFDGNGRCVVSDEILAHNDVWEISELEDVYASYFGCSQVTVLPALAGEGTGHVDMFVTLTGPAEAIVGAYLDGSDLENAERLDESATLLREAGFTVRRVPMPTNQDGRFRSYTNALAVNGSVFVPIYLDDRRYEARALAVFAEAYPGRRIVPIDSTELIQWSGSIHCLTMTVTR